MKNFPSDNVVIANFENKKFPTITYFRLDHSKSNVCTTKISEALKCSYTLPTTWKELADEISNGIDHVAFHIDDLHDHQVSVKEFVDTIHTLNKTIKGRVLKIGAVITKKTTQQVVTELKNTGVHGILLDINDFEFEDVCICSKNFIIYDSHFPKFIIDTLPNIAKKPINVFFRKDCATYFKNIGGTEAVKKLSTDAPWQVLMCSSWDELGKAMESNPYQICLHVDMVTKYGATMNECVSMIETLLRVSNLKNVPISLGVDKNTNMSVIKEAQKCNLHGIVPAAIDFGIEEAYKGLEALYNRIPYWPKHILEQLPGAKKTVTKNSIILTPRQVQIVDLIKERGLSNKKIAQSLNITESTVKIHVSAILKAYGVRTRTQLAVVTNR